MSIIHEALKKVQSNRAEKPISDDNSSPIKNPPLLKNNLFVGNSTTSTPPRAKNINSILWGWFIFALLFVTFYNLYEYRKQIEEAAKTKFSAQNLSEPQPTKTTPVLTSTLPTAVQPRKGEIILSGIVQMDDKDFALINNKFYEAGEVVDDALIKKITSDSVEIIQKEKTRIIKVLRPE